MNGFWDLNEETRVLIDDAIRVDQAADGRWRAWLAVEHDFMRNGTLPPGQTVQIGDGEYLVSSEFDFIERQYLREKLETDPEFRAHYRKQWAARPYFETDESARAMMRGWIMRERPDIVRESSKVAAETYAYRAAKAK